MILCSQWHAPCSATSCGTPGAAQGRTANGALSRCARVYTTWPLQFASEKDGLSRSYGI